MKTEERLTVMRAKEALEVLKVHRVTLNRYVREGRINVTKLANGRYEYNDNDVFAFVGKRKETHGTKVISYSRVSTYEQRNQLKEQTQRIYESCVSRGLQLDEQFEDIGSGMSSDRKNLDKICQMIFQGEVETLIVENKDRLVRFGFDMLEKFFKYFGCQIIVLNDAIENKTYEQELTDDLISVIHYFTMKSYSHRRKLNKIRKELENERKSSNLEN